VTGWTPTDEDLIAFARSRSATPNAVAKNRDLWATLCRVSNGLEHLPVGYGD